jgi:hypothetical protein
VLYLGTPRCGRAEYVRSGTLVAEH